jgi:hypothetical protein
MLKIPYNGFVIEKIVVHGKDHDQAQNNCSDPIHELVKIHWQGYL